MYLSDLALTDFRSYHRALVSLERGVTVLVGDNGQGKTNLVEAIGYLSTLASHRVSADSALIRQGAQAAVIQARVQQGTKPVTVEVEIYAGRANRARINRGQVRPPEILGIVRTVLFAPEDLGLVKGEPRDRRAFLDSILIQLRPRLAGVIDEYAKVARHRSAFLKTAGGKWRRGGAVDTTALDVWDMQLARLGAQLTAARVDLVRRLRPHVEFFYRVVSGGKGVARLDYRASASRGIFDLPDALAIDSYAAALPGSSENAGTSVVSGKNTSQVSEQLEVPAASDPKELIDAHEVELLDVELTEVRLLNAMATRRDEELTRGVNLVGPHRDELVLSLGSMPAKGFASHGESWSYALALKLAAWEVLRSDGSGDFEGDGEPILILDDVFAELDSRRRERLAEIVREAGQVFVTAAVGSELPEGLHGKEFRVSLGEVSEVDHG